MLHRRPLVLLGSYGLALTMILTACTIGPSTRPELAVYGGDVAPPASSTQVPTPPPTGPGGPGQDGQFDTDWAGCSSDIPSDSAPGVTIECTTLDVPKQYSGTTAGRDTLTLQIARARAADLPADAPSLVVLMANGPVDSGMAGTVMLAQVAASLPPEISSAYQVVTLDLRGSGDSVELSCLEGGPLEEILALPADPSTAAGSANLATTTRDFTFACEDYAGSDIVVFNTSNIADDLDSLRSALGVETLNVLGVGYGATVAAVYTDRYPARVGKVVIDAPTDHLAPPSERAVIAAGEYEKRLATFAAACDADKTCPLAGSAREQIIQVVTDLGGNPARAGNGLRVNAGTALFTLMAALPNSDLWPDLASAFEAATGGDVDAIGELVEKLIDSYGAELSLRLVIDCNDTDERISTTDLTALAKASMEAAPLFGPYLVGWAGLCSSWPAPDQPLAGLRGQGAAPVLVIGGAADAAAPYPGVQAVENQLASATLLTWQGGDHGSYTRSNCISQAATGYLLTGQTPSGGTVCPA